MASNLAGDICIGQFNACLLRVALLDANCGPTGGADTGIITPGLVTLTATPDVEEGTVYEPKTGCGNIGFTVEKPDRVKRYNHSATFLFLDFELQRMLFGGNLVLGIGGGPYAGEVIGHSEPAYDADPGPSVYLEIITEAVGQGVGDCTSPGADFPTHIGYIFGKGRYTPGESTFEEDVFQVSFTGKSTGNPNLGTGPWQDWPGVGAVPNSPRIKVGYSQTQYDAIEDLARCGYQTLPIASG